MAWMAFKPPMISAGKNFNMESPRWMPRTISVGVTAPARMGKVVYTDTWLWHKSGRFQLDTLTEGQD